MAMYTEEQGRQALLHKMMLDFQKQVALDNHKHAIEWIEQYNLPYRISLDYHKNEHDIFDVGINPFYPLPKVPIEGEWHYKTDTNYTDTEWFDMITRPTGEISQDGKTMVEIYTPLEIQALIDEKQKPYKLWDLNTEQGKEQWLYYFAVFILPYADKIPTWSCFDVFGDNKHTQQEVEERKQYYLDLIDYCKHNPTKYQHEVQQKQLSDYDKYDFWWGYMWRDSFECKPPQSDMALEIMYKEKERYLKHHDKWEMNNQYSEGYRIQQIIEQLEQEHQ